MSVDPIVLLAFIPAALALNLTPGADMMFCLGQGLRSGHRSAVAASAGVFAGGMVHVTLAGLGLGAAVAAMPWVFDVIRWVGVGYLLFLAWGAFRNGAIAADAPQIPAGRAFRAGFAVNLTNPKFILFVLAFLPQFVNPAAPVLAQFLIFGFVLSIGGFLANGAVGLFAGRAGQMLIHNAAAGRWLGRISGTIFAGLALRLAILERT